jgi:hypothetical protein
MFDAGKLKFKKLFVKYRDFGYLGAGVAVRA